MVYKSENFRTSVHFKMYRRFLLVVGLIAGLTNGQSSNEDVEPTMRISYEGNQLWRAMVDDDLDRRIIVELRDKGHISTWGGSRRNLDILVKPNSTSHVEAALRSQNISYEVVIRNLQTAINEENPPLPVVTDDRNGHPLTWKAYHRAKDIFAFLDYLGQTYPDLCTVSNMGISHEGRPLKVLKISNGNSGNKAIWIDGGIHAREWISPAATTYIINHLIANYENEPEYMQNIDFYIAPLLNPDGYEYTHSVDRIWRKNKRQSVPGRCFGTDLNRNFGYKWGLEGVSKDPCSDIYGGTGPFSEPESRAMKRFIEGTKVNWKAYISFHSYGQYILYSWGYSKAVSPDYQDLEKVGRRVRSAILQSGGPNYTVGPAGYTLYPAAGGSDDWAKGSIHMKYAYTIELRDSGRFGFILPAAYIKPSSTDALSAVRVIAEAVHSNDGK